MKKIIGILLSLCMVMCFMPSFAFADGSYDEVTLEMEFSDGHCGNGAELWSGSPEVIKFLKAYWNGNNFEKKYITNVNEIKVSSQDITLKYKGNDEFEVTINSNLKSEEEYAIEYAGNDRLDRESVHIKAHSSGQKDFIEKVGFRNVKAKSTTKGNLLTWKTALTTYSPDYYIVFRSTTKSKGYKEIGRVNGITKAYTDKDGITKGKTYYYKVCAFVNFSFGPEKSKYSSISSCKTKKTFEKLSFISLNKEQNAAYGKSMLKYATIFGLPKNISWINNPKDKNDLDNNILYKLLIGDYGMNIIFPKGTSEDDLNNMGEYICNKLYDFGLDTYDGLAAFYVNEGINYKIKYKNAFPVIQVYSDADKSFSAESLDFVKVFKEQKEALQAAIKLKEKLHNDGTIKAGMTQKEIMEAYYEALYQYTEVDEESTRAMLGKDPNARYNYHCSDIYGFFVKKLSVCSGRAAGFGLSMRLEGIPTYGITVPGHKINVCFIDGKEYYIDTGNHFPASDLATAVSKFGNIEEKSDVDARAALKKLLSK